MGKLYDNKHKPKRAGKKVTVGKAEAVPPGRSATVQLKNGGEVALFNVGGKFYAIENFCPHKAAPLADSRIYGNIVECDLHVVGDVSKFHRFLILWARATSFDHLESRQTIYGPTI